MGKIELNLPAPSPRQREFLEASQRYIAFGGARGGGKSFAVRLKASLMCLYYPGIRIMLIRCTYPALRQNHIIPMKEMLSGCAVFKESTKDMVFQNGSVISFRYCRNISDLEKFQGTECDVLFIDEATQFTEEMFDRLKACVRGVNSFPKRIYITCNPGGRGHGWVKRLFIDRAMKSGEEKDDYFFIRSLVTDNHALMENDPSYIKKLEALPPKLKKAWLFGDWNIFEGQFFEEFADQSAHYSDRRFTHVIEPFEIPRDWTIYRSFDFGYSKPFSCDWWAIDYDGRAYLILQLYGCNGNPNEGVKWDPDRIFSRIHRIETEHRWLSGKHIHGVADPSIWDASRGDSIIEAAGRNFVYFQPGDNKRIPGWMQCHYRLRFDDEGYPMVYFFNTCKDAIRTLPLLTYSESSPEDLDTSDEDHFADSFRYFCMSRPIRPIHNSDQSSSGDDPLDLLADKQRYKQFSY
ncbi:MAG: Terminase-like family protein [Ruminococcaceae bacterium]|nr:Terminase-like family protein [Oscillospiraceae bacterium]